MIASAVLIGINFQTQEILKQFFSLKDGEANPILACEGIKKQMEPLCEGFVFSIVANDEARDLYAQNIEKHRKT